MFLSIALHVEFFQQTNASAVALYTCWQYLVGSSGQFSLRQSHCIQHECTERTEKKQEEYFWSFLKRPSSISANT